jgi:hypothetical protein
MFAGELSGPRQFHSLSTPAQLGLGLCEREALTSSPDDPAWEGLVLFLAKAQSETPPIQKLCEQAAA